MGNPLIPLGAMACGVPLAMQTLQRLSRHGLAEYRETMAPGRCQNYSEGAKKAPMPLEAVEAFGEVLISQAVVSVENFWEAPRETWRVLYLTWQKRILN